MFTNFFCCYRFSIANSNRSDFIDILLFIYFGRFSEILRVIDSLQLVDRLPYVATPANWVVSIKYTSTL